jgi:hypothetical protein
MLKKLMITTAVTGLMMGGAAAQSTPPSQSPAAQPPAASPSAPAAKSQDMSKPAPAAKSSEMSKPAPAAGSAKFIHSQKPDQLLASSFKGTDVVGGDNEKVGDISDILFDKSGKIEAYVVTVGGFLGIGSKSVALEPSAFEVVAGDKSKNESDKLKIAMTKDQLKQAASFEPYKPPQSTASRPSTTGMGGGTPRPTPR